jgi:hypothetical protein
MAVSNTEATGGVPAALLNTMNPAKNTAKTGVE